MVKFPVKNLKKVEIFQRNPQITPHWFPGFEKIFRNQMVHCFLLYRLSFIHTYIYFFTIQDLPLNFFFSSDFFAWFFLFPGFFRLIFSLPRIFSLDFFSSPDFFAWLFLFHGLYYNVASNSCINYWQHFICKTSF